MSAGWREHDLRGDEGRARSVAGVVRSARRALAVARIGEAALLGATALCLGLAAAAWTGAGPDRVDAWTAAAACAACAGVAWWYEHRRSPDDVARALDRKLRHQGALVTAFEVERRADAGPLAPLVVAHVLERLRRGEAVRALRPGLALPVAAPLVGAAVLAGVLQAVSVEPPPRSVAKVAGGLAGRLTDTLGRAFAEEAVDLELVRTLRSAAAQARGLADDLGDEADEAGAPPEDAARRIEELDRTLAALAAEAAAHPGSAADLRVELAAARSWLDALRREIGAAPEGTEPAPEPDPATGTGEAGVTETAGDGTMSGSTSPAGGGEDPPSSPPQDGAPAGGGDHSAGGAVETGTVAGTWWPAEHDEIVRRWLERVRADRR